VSNVLKREKQIEVLHHLVEGNMLRSTARLTKTHRNAIQNLLVDFGQKCQAFMDRELHLPAYCAFGLWIAFQIVIAFIQTHAAGDVSGLAHLGGASVGFIAWSLRRFFIGKAAIE